MAIEIEPIFNEPALVVENEVRSLVIADIHLGIEWDLYTSGFSIPSRMQMGLDRILGYIQTVQPERLILLGDVKHNVPQISWQERDELPYFLRTLAEHVHVDILPGNHDAGIEFLLPEGKDLQLHSSRGAIIDSVGYFHGHTWPAPELLKTEYIITAHNHPTIRFTDPLGHVVVEPAWVRTKLKKEVLQSHYSSLDLNEEWKDPKVFIVPSFNELCGGVAFNESLEDDLLGPIFSSGAMELDNAELYLLDGTKLGLLKHVRKLHGPKKERKVRRKERK
ncbi:MAG: metallophosphoesterase [Methanomethylovorans sp.]|uniref:metallophosphoesterase n=1 Tax=Methanomethylovorans sp. TaxID=2758717 RepID=UPI0035307418